MWKNCCIVNDLCVVNTVAKRVKSYEKAPFNGLVSAICDFPHNFRTQFNFFSFFFPLFVPHSLYLPLSLFLFFFLSAAVKLQRINLFVLGQIKLTKIYCSTSIELNSVVCAKRCPIPCDSSPYSQLQRKLTRYIDREMQQQIPNSNHMGHFICKPRIILNSMSLYRPSGERIDLYRAI